MRKKNCSKLIAVAIAIVMMAPMGMLASNAVAQTSAPATSSAPNSQVPQPDQGGVNWQGVGYGTGSLLTNILYIPAKLVYAILGGLIGGGAWLVTAGNGQTADTIWRSSLGGDYVVTPDMLAGKEPLHFSGPTSTEPIPADSTVQPLTAAPSSPEPTAYTPPPPAAGSPPGSQPMDRGAGAVRPGGPSTLPDTSIE
ncbi:MAG TPA: hypothetical protein VN867_16480 [Candidatus Binataceae bacterium]|nr:hypothetical protein [Candidatus Binataceae bacterium]